MTLAVGRAMDKSAELLRTAADAGDTEACFALAYAHKQTHLIPDHIEGIGYADESSVVRTVLIENEKMLAEYCKRQGLDFAEVTTKA